MPDVGNRPFSPAQLAERWDVSKRTVLRICKAGTIRCFQVGRDYRITPEAVAEFEARDCRDTQRNEQRTSAIKSARPQR